MRQSKSTARLYVLLAREASVGVVFRRGPSGKVLIVKWNLKEDTFETGQWLKGRIYERRCDLSPDGRLLIYFAANQKPPYSAWTAISRPPFLKALALWPKRSCWGGGGQFYTATRILLNHEDHTFSLAEGYHLPKAFSVEALGPHSGGGEDDPIWSWRLQRDGWLWTQWPQELKEDRSGAIWIENVPAKVWQKPHPKWPEKYKLRQSILGINEGGGPWHVIEHAILGPNGAVDSIGRSEWADWDHNGDLLFAQSGCLYRLSPRRGKFPPVELSKTIADLNGLVFNPLPAPPEASVWPKVRKNRADGPKSASRRS